MSDLKRITRIKRDLDKSAYRKGYEDGGFAGAAAVALIFAFVVFVVIPLLP
jgi:hypothetical protein